MKSRKQQRNLFLIIAGAAVLIILVVILSVMNKTKMVDYVNYQKGFSLQYPEGWKVMEEFEGVNEVMATFLSPKDNDLDKYIENVTIIKQDILATQNQKMSLAQYTALALKQMEAVFKADLVVLESKPITLNGRPAYRYLFKGKQKSDDDTAIQNLVVWMLDGNTAYQLIYTSQEFNYKLHEREAERLIRSFEIL